MAPVTFEADRLPSVAWDKFKQFRLQEKLIDITIIVDGISFRAHKLILSSCSEYFETMFLSNFLESQQTEITLNNVSAKAFSIILDYCYNEKITLDGQNAQDVLAASSLMQMTDIQMLCAEYIKSTISVANCLGILNIAEQYNLKDLVHVAMKFTLDKFEEVVKDPDSEFTLLDVDWLTKLIKHDGLNIDDELKIFKAVLMWLSQGNGSERRDSIDALLPNIRFPLMEPKSLVNLSKIIEDLVVEDLSIALQESKIFHSLVDEAKNHHLLKHCYPDEKLRAVGDRFRERIASRRLSQRIFAVGGWTNEYKPIASVEKYNPYEDTWEHVKPMSSPRCGVGVAIIGNSLYAVGGHDGQNYLKSVERYDIEEDTWNKDVADMHTERTSVGVVALNGYLYAIGGQANSSSGSPSVSSLANVERYDPSTNKWEECAKLNERRLGAAVTVLNGLIYVIGGADQVPSNTVECYDPSTDTWRYVAPMRHHRKHLGCTSHDGGIVAVGGRNETDELDNAEFYEPKRDKWFLFVQMNEKRSGLGLVELDGRLYAAGGHNGSYRLRLVECYDPETTLWKTKKCLGQERLGGGFAVYSQLPEI